MNNMQPAIIDGVREWLKTCPLLADSRLNVDFLPEEAKSYSVDSVPCRDIIRKYIDGSARRQFMFVIASREFYSGNIAENIDTHAFYEQLQAWVESQSKRRNFPKLGEKRQGLSIEVSSTAYPFIVDESGKARYQIQLVLVFFQKGERRK